MRDLEYFEVRNDNEKDTVEKELTDESSLLPFQVQVSDEHIISKIAAGGSKLSAECRWWFNLSYKRKISLSEFI